MAAPLSATFCQADIRRAVAAAPAVDIVVARLGVADDAGRIVILATPPGSIPAKIGELDQAAE